MKEMGEYLVELLTWLAAQKTEPLRIVETGTMRSLDPQEDGRSTLHIARWIQTSGQPHEFLSLELSHGSIVASRQLLREQGLDGFIIFALGDAEKILEHLCLPIDFIYLDAGADPLENLAQFRRAQKWLRPPGFAVIDDVYDPRNANRGLLTVPIAQLEGFKTAKIAERMAAIAFGSATEYPLEWQ